MEIAPFRYRTTCSMFYNIGYVISHLMILLIKLSKDLGLEICMSATT